MEIKVGQTIVYYNKNTNEYLVGKITSLSHPFYTFYTGFLSGVRHNIANGRLDGRWKFNISIHNHCYIFEPDFRDYPCLPFWIIQDGKISYSFFDYSDRPLSIFKDV